MGHISHQGLPSPEVVLDSYYGTWSKSKPVATTSSIMLREDIQTSRWLKFNQASQSVPIPCTTSLALGFEQTSLTIMVEGEISLSIGKTYTRYAHDDTRAALS